MTKTLITGASSGIGAALATKLAGEGHEVWLAARRVEALEAEVAKIRASGGRAHAIAIDVAEHEATMTTVGALDRDAGGLDLVIANAGVGSGPVAAVNMTFTEAKRTLDTNLLGAMATIIPVVGRMVERGRGHIVGVSSLAAEVPLPAAVDYGVSKAALSFYLESLGADIRPKGVFVTVVHPGFVKTPMTDKNDFAMPFMTPVEKAAAIIARGIKRHARMVRFPFPLSVATSTSRALPRVLRDALINSNRPKVD